MKHKGSFQSDRTWASIVAGLAIFSLSLTTSPASALPSIRLSQQQQGEPNPLDRLFQQGRIFYQSDRYTEALQAWQQALSGYQSAGDRPGEGAVIGNLGAAYRALGQYANAIEQYQQALKIHQALSNPHEERRMLGNLGNAYALMGQYDRALDYQQQSREIAQTLQDREREKIILANLGATAADQGDYEAAIGYYQESLSIARALGEKTAEASVLCNLGTAHNSGKREHNLAVDYYEQCLAAARVAGDRWLEAEALSSLGFAYEGLKAFETAMTHYDAGLALFREIDSYQSAAVTLNNRAHTLLEWHKAQPDKTRLQVAESNLRDAIQILEAQRETLTSDADRVSLFDTQVATYNLLQQVLIIQDEPEAALVAAEEGRSRAFTTLLAENQSSLSPDFDLQKIQQFAQENQATIVEYTLVPDDNFIHQGRTRGESEALYIWVVLPTGEVRFEFVDLKEQNITLTRDVEQTLRAMGVNGDRGLAAEGRREASYVKDLQTLHNVLVSPIEKHLPDDLESPVIFVPQGELFLVPFAALADADETYLIEKHTILTAPSIQVLQLSQTARTRPVSFAEILGADFLIVGNPTMPEVWDPNGQKHQVLQDLPAAGIEAKAISDLFGGMPLIAQQATEAVVKAQIETAGVVHLATHGLLEYGNPEDSGVSDVSGAIALTPDNDNDGLLTAAEISTLSLTADLVVLSACDTGLGQITGDGVIGLSRSLLSAGAANVVVSLWSVPDAPTAELMEVFYTQLQQGASKAQALRSAMLTTMEGNPHPSDWAGFTLIGQTD